MNLKPIVAMLMATTVGIAQAASGPVHPPLKNACKPSAGQQFTNKVMNGNSAQSKGAAIHCRKKHVRVGGEVELLASQTHIKDALTFTDDTHNRFGLNNLNLFLDSDLGDHFGAHVNLHYGNADLFNIDASADHINQFSVDEAFITYRMMQDRLQLKAGKFYSSFGSYDDPYNAVPSLTQWLNQTNDTMLEATFVPMTGAYVKGWAFSHPMTGEENTLDKFGFKAGYSANIGGVVAGINAAVINDARVLSSSASDGSMGIKQWIMSDMKNPAVYKKVAAYAGDVTLGFGPFSIIGQLTAFADNVAVAGGDSKPQILGVGAAYHFSLAGKDNTVSVSYEKADDKGADVFKADKRMAAEYKIALNKGLAFKVDLSQLDMKPVAGKTGQINIGSLGLEARF